MGKPLTHMRMDTDTHAAVSEIAEAVGLGVGPVVEILFADALGVDLHSWARTEAVRTAVRRYRSGLPIRA